MLCGPRTTSWPMGITTNFVSQQISRLFCDMGEMRGLLPFDSEIVAVLQLMSFGLAFTKDRNHRFTAQAITYYTWFYTRTFLFTRTEFWKLAELAITYAN